MVLVCPAIHRWPFVGWMVPSDRTAVELVPSTTSPLQMALTRRITGHQFCSCQYAAAKQQEYALAAMALARAKSDG